MAPGFKAARKFLNNRLGGNNRPNWLKLPTAVQHDRNSGEALSVCLIVKNEEAFLGQCLKSVKDIATQIVVVDTGSTDRTIEIAKDHGAEVYSFAWCDDFSVARNAALEHVTGDWVLMLDADEELSPAACAALRQHIAQREVMAWRLPLVDVGHEAEGASYVPRLFRNAPGLFFVGRIHEQVFSSVEARRAEWGLENRIGEATILHHGYTAAVARDRNKLERNLRLLERAVEEQPEDPNLLMNLGQELSRAGREPESLVRYWQAFECLSSKPAAEIPPELRQTLLSQFCTRLTAAKQFRDIVSILTSPAGKLGMTASLHFALGLAHLELGEFTEAVEQLQLCLAKRGERSFCPINKDINTAAPYHCLALAQAQLGSLSEADQSFQSGLKETGYTEGLRIDYARFLFEQDRPIDALQCLNQAIASDVNQPAVWRLGGQIALSRPDFLEFAVDWTGEAVRHVPNDATVLAQRAEVLLLTQQLAPSAQLWSEVERREHSTRAVAALIFCQLADPATKSASLAAPADSELVGVTRAFIEWYRKCVGAGANQLVLSVNGRLPELRVLLPQAADLIESALAEAAAPA
jgi:tetratricopeptide (TPR) repeat protein